MPLKEEAALAVPLVHSGDRPPGDILRLLRTEVELRATPMAQFANCAAQGECIVILDTYGLTDDDLAVISAWRASPSGAGVAAVFVTDPEMRAKLIRLGLSKGANLVRRPLSEGDLPGLLRQLSPRRSPRLDAQATGARQKHYAAFPAQAEALKACDDILDEIFGSFATAERLEAGAMADRSSLVIDSLRETGLSGWIEAVRLHHDSTYQHCLLVTGTLLAFGQYLKMRNADLQALTLGGLLHDIGKADMPTGILDKPTALTPEEIAVMRAHPLTGLKRLKSIDGATALLEAFVRDHHEYLDGSGYPNGLTAESISDPVRLLTIADIFSALIERRSYKPAMPAAQAIEILKGMGGKIDQLILASVEPVLRKVAA